MEPYVLMLQTDPEDRELTESIVNEFNFSVPLKFLAEAEEIDNYTAAVGFPSLLLVSDSSRGMAVSLVKKLKSKAAYSHIPVIILAERSLNSYAKYCYRAGANSFVIKPSTLEETRKKIEFFFKYWFEVAEL
jgi:DNA-binding response OmpR family regulator